MKNVALLTEIISPYRIPVFNHITQSLKDHFLVLFFAETERRRKWKIDKRKIRFHYEVLPGILFQKKGFTPHFFNPTIFLRLLEYSPDIVIIGGYHHPSSLLALFYAKLFKRQIILWCESNKYDLRFRHPLKTLYKRWFVKNCSGYIVPGRASFEYLISLGAVAQKIWVAPNAVDNDYFTQVNAKYKASKESFKQSKGYPKKLILYVGRLIEQKGISDLLKVFQTLFSEEPELGLVFVGNGEQEKRYQFFCLENNLKKVFFEGYINQEELPLYYTIADVFVLPTHSDPWGLVLNEAMACKLPVISSDVSGAAYDLIKQGENGYIFKKGDTHQLISYLKDILSDEQKRIIMGQKSFDIIKDYSPAKCAQGFIQAIREV